MYVTGIITNKSLLVAEMKFFLSDSESNLHYRSSAECEMDICAAMYRGLTIFENKTTPPYAFMFQASAACVFIAQAKTPMVQCCFTRVP